MIGLRTHLSNRCWARKIFEKYPDVGVEYFKKNRDEINSKAAYDFQIQGHKEEKIKQRIR